MDVQTNLSVNSPVPCSYAVIDGMAMAWLALYLLLIPLFAFVFYVGYRHRKRRQSPLSHSDVITFHIIAMEIISIIGDCVYIAGIKTGSGHYVGVNMFAVGLIGQMCFHCLTCVQRYLAVVHPVTYLRLKKRGGAMIRNIVIAGTWVISVGSRTFHPIDTNRHLGGILEISLGFFFCVVVAFCSVSVLCVLTHPGPGERGGDLRRTDQSKQRAFFTIMVIMGMLLVRCLFFVVDYVMTAVQDIDRYYSCLLSFSASFFNLPSSLLLPLMFLQKYGKLPKCSVRKLQFKCK